MSESGFETYLFKERSERWEIKNKIEKVEKKLKYMLSNDNNACFGKYIRKNIWKIRLVNCFHSLTL